MNLFVRPQGKGVERGAGSARSTLNSLTLGPDNSPLFSHLHRAITIRREDGASAHRNERKKAGHKGMHIVTIEEMRELEERAGREYGLTSPILMETAGRSAAELLAGEIEQVNGQEFLLLIGPGNNGGDGLVIARHLKDWGGL